MALRTPQPTEFAARDCFIRGVRRCGAGATSNRMRTVVAQKLERVAGEEEGDGTQNRRGGFDLVDSIRREPNPSRTESVDAEEHSGLL